MARRHRAQDAALKPFVFTGLASRVVFGAGSVRELPAEIERLGAKRALLLTTPGRASMVSAIGKHLKVAGIYDKVVMHTPIEAATEARNLAASLNADCCIAVGGGSTIGFGKAIALTSGLPVVAVPTTYSGSEMTTIWGISENNLKKTGRDPKVLPRVVVYDPELTLDLPAAVSAASGMNAIAHCAEALYAHDGNPIVSLMAEEGIRALSESLPRIISDGCTIATTSVALHHKLCHVLGGFGLPHAETHSIVLPHALKYNSEAAPEAMQRIANALQGKNLWDLQKGLGLPMRLADIGMNEADIERAARLAVAAPYPNPRKVEYDPVLELLRNAWEGRRP